MSTHVEGHNIEAEIAECCQAINAAKDVEIALKHWARLRELMVQRQDALNRQFIRATMHEGTENKKP
jgi:hypothetical protein